MIETQSTICAWADETFGPAPSLFRVVARANEEMAEVIRAISTDKPLEAIREECADCAIVCIRALKVAGNTHWNEPKANWADAPALIAVDAHKQIGSALRYAFYPDNRKCVGHLLMVVRHLADICHTLGGMLGEEIDDKMSRNRKRQWKRDGTGHGYHVRDKSKTEAA